MSPARLQEMRKAMSNRGKSTLVENAMVLALIGVLAGAIGGLAIGVVTSPKATSTTSTSSSNSR
jgi:hypothetical protein